MGTSYSDPGDLLVGDMAYEASEAKRFADGATDEINSVLGFVYEIPLLPWPPIAHVVILLKRCNNLIATGRFIMARATGSEDLSLHAYGKSLLNEGQELLEQMRSGMIDLPFGKVETFATEGNAPAILNRDSASAVDAFYAYVGDMAPVPWWPGPIWAPGS